MTTTIAASLGRVARLWLDRSHPLRSEAVSALQVSTGFSLEMIESALASAFEELTEEKILAFCDSEPAFTKTAQAPKSILHILAGNVFTAWLPGVVTSLLLGSRCVLKPSSREPVFAHLWKRSVREAAPGLAERIEIRNWEEGLLTHYPAIVAYGSDETLAALRSQVPAGTQFIGYGHKLSIGIVWKESLVPESVGPLIEALRADIEPFDLQGCLSPQALYLEGTDPGIWERLAARVRVMPRLKRFKSWDEVKAELSVLRPSLSTLGYAGPENRLKGLQTDLQELGFSRVCRLGEMQRPSLLWRNGGLSLAEALMGERLPALQL